MSDDKEIIIIVEEGCPACEILKDKVKGKVRFVEGSSLEGISIIHKFAMNKIDLKYIPQCIIKEGDEVRFCTNTEENLTVYKSKKDGS